MVNLKKKSIVIVIAITFEIAIEQLWNNSKYKKKEKKEKGL